MAEEKPITSHYYWSDGKFYRLDLTGDLYVKTEWGSWIKLLNQVPFEDYKDVEEEF